MTSLRFCSLLLLCALAACIPARVPDNLDDTPGPPVVIVDQVYRGETFSAQVPAGWRIITSEARAPQAVIFVAPDEQSTIRLTAGTLTEAELPAGEEHELRVIDLGEGVRVTAALSAPADVFAALQPTFEAVAASVQ
ncbi:MAG: hypothetical protein JNJ61_04970 [Anaerolineae bacterium]|nr:hypothetical protein [Anaerolineae bacterium]